MGIRRLVGGEGEFHEEIGWEWRDSVKGRLEGMKLHYEKLGGD